MSKLINRYLSKTDFELIDKLEKAVKSTSLSLTCMGLYNHGKSTILNSLIKDFEQKTFKTADIRETSQNKSVKVGNITYIDTPGLNATVHDDKRVMDAVKESDLNLFVHTVTTGEFVAKEMEFLNNVKKHWENPKQFIERTIFVVSRIDKANNEEDVKNTVAKMSNQVLDIFGLKPMIVAISAMRYIKGKQDNKKLMIKKSNIETLEIVIEELTTQLITEVQDTRKKRVEKHYDNFIQKFHSKIQLNKLEIAQQKQVERKFTESLHNDISNIENTLEKKYSSLGA